MTCEFLRNGRFPDASGSLYQQCGITVAPRLPFEHCTVNLPFEINHIIFHFLPFYVRIYALRTIPPNFIRQNVNIHQMFSAVSSISTKCFPFAG